MGRGAIILRTYAGGRGSMKSVQEHTRGEGGSEIGNFTAYVLYGCPLIEAQLSRDIVTSKPVYVT